MSVNKKKKKITAVLSIVLVAVIAIGATLAYLATKTDEESNVFTFAENIKAGLDEPNWDPDDAGNLIPGYEVRKDPMITNLSDNGVDEYVALKITFTRGDGTTLSDAETARLLSCLTVTWNSSWSLKSGTATSAVQVYVYQNALSTGEVTDPVFSSVTINSDISDADYAWLAGIVTNHTDDCYEYTTAHDPAQCTITYKHHANCASLTGGTCDCTPAQQHESDCPALTGTLKASCSHTVPGNAISGFQIKVQGAAVQAGVEGMTAWNAADTITNLKALFGL